MTAGATGSGDLSFPQGEVRFGLSETRLAAGAELTLTGAAGGSALGVANVSASANPVQVAEDCAGAGLPGAPVNIHLQTAPSISG